MFSVGEQKFFAEKGFTPPSRCKPCRDKRKAQNQNGQNGQTAAAPIREYISRPRIVEAPPPSREDKEQRQRRRSKNRRPDDYDGADW